MVQVQLYHQVLYRLGTHLGRELVAEFFHRLVVLLVRKQLSLLQRGHTWVGYHVGFKVQYALDIAQGHIQQQADARRQ